MWGFGNLGHYTTIPPRIRFVTKEAQQRMKELLPSLIRSTVYYGEDGVAGVCKVDFCAWRTMELLER